MLPLAPRVFNPQWIYGAQYLDSADNVLPFDAVTGLVDSTKVAKVQIDLQARTKNPDLQNGQYRTIKLTALVQVRGQYIPAVGF